MQKAMQVSILSCYQRSHTCLQHSTRLARDEQPTTKLLFKSAERASETPNHRGETVTEWVQQ